MKTEKEFKSSHLTLILKTQHNLLDLMNEGVLSKETVDMYIYELNKKYDEIKKQLKN